MCVHKLLNHESIIKFYGSRRDGHMQYLFLEYACGGELFDRIGMFHHQSFRVETRGTHAVPYIGNFLRGYNFRWNRQKKTQRKINLAIYVFIESPWNSENRTRWTLTNLQSVFFAKISGRKKFLIYGIYSWNMPAVGSYSIESVCATISLPEKLVVWTPGL